MISQKHTLSSIRLISSHMECIHSTKNSAAVRCHTLPDRVLDIEIIFEGKNGMALSKNKRWLKFYHGSTGFNKKWTTVFTPILFFHSFLFVELSICVLMFHPFWSSPTKVRFMKYIQSKRLMFAWNVLNDPYLTSI